MKKRILITVCMAVALCCCAAFMAGCQQNTRQVAATVDGAEIYEDQITSDVDTFRKSYGVTDEESWGKWLAQYNYTPSAIRDAMLDSYIEQELVKKAAKENDVSVEDSKVDEYVNQMKQQYNDDAKWEEALSSAGFTEDTYRDRVRESLLEQAVMEKVTPYTEPDANTMLTYAKAYASYFNGAKRSSRILFNSNDKEKAQQVLDQINAGTISFEDAAKQYSTDTASAANGGDVGWDKLNDLGTAYTNALNGLATGQVSGLVDADNGINIIKCTETFTAPAEITSLDQLPTAFVDVIKENVQKYQQQNDFEKWISDYKGKANIDKKDMPSGLSYDVDMSKYSNYSNNNNSNSSNNSNNSNAAGNTSNANQNNK